MARSRVMRWGAVLVAAMAVLASCAPPPPDNGFSQPPPQLSSFRPGDVIRSRPWSFTQDAIGRRPVPGVTATQFMYRSTNALDRPMAVTGTLLVPTAPWSGAGRRPLVSYAVGTRGLGDECAPSRTLATGIDYESGVITRLLDRGWAVVVSDMEGLGTPGVHTYEVGRSQGRAVLDAARAAVRLPGGGVSRRAPVAVMGYSQGGTSAGWAAQLAPRYAPELRLVGVAAGGVAADLVAVADAAEGALHVGLVLLAALGLDAAYPELRLDSYVNARGRDLLQRGRATCLVSVDGIATFLGVAGARTDDFVTSVNPLSTPAWRARLEENRLGGSAPRVPVLMQHGGLDNIIPLPQAEELRREWCAAGATVDWMVHPGAEHVLGFLAMVDPAVQFLADRFAGRPPLDDCPSESAAG